MLSHEPEVFGITEVERPTISDVPREVRDPGVTEYVRWRVEQIKAGGVKGNALAARVGLSPATISQLASDQGVGSRSIGKWAKALGFPDIPSLRRTAYEWYNEQMAEASALLDEPAVVAAIDLVATDANVNKEHVAAILTAFSHPRFRGRPLLFWASLLAIELTFERQLRDEVERGAHLEDHKKKHAQATVRDSFRRKAREKKGKTNEESTQPDASPRSRRRAGGVQ